MFKIRPCLLLNCLEKSSKDIKEDVTLIEDYKAFYGAIEVGFRNGTNCLLIVLTSITETSPSSSLERAIDVVKASLNNSVPVESQDYFLRTALPKFVQYLLQRK